MASPLLSSRNEPLCSISIKSTHGFYINDLKAIAIHDLLLYLSRQNPSSFVKSLFLPGAADLGVCLHTSSSGLDLPMKVLNVKATLIFL